MQQPYVYQSAVGTEPPEVPGGWFAKNKRRLAVGGVVAAALLVVLLVILFFVNRHRATVALRQQEIAAQTAAVENTVKECEDTQNPTKCAGAARPSLAQESGKASYCEGLSGIDYDNCVALAALTSLREEDCRLIVDATKKEQCLQVVKKLNDYEPTVWSAELQAAIDARDPARCAAIVDQTDQGTCYEIVGPGDVDLDGLNAQQEMEWGTKDSMSDSDGDGLSDSDEVNIWKSNPANPDSDADGYPDGIEVQGGYNPNGAGKL